MKDVMIDFETFGNGKHACLCQIGAVYFDSTTGELGAEYKANIDAANHSKLGGDLDADTVYWWLAQSIEARQSILQQPRKNVVDVMNELNQFLSSATRVWSHATFDFVILMNTLKQLDIKPLFSYKAGLDIRTLTYLAGITIDKTERTGVHHDGLEDAKHQVKYCVEALNAVKGNKQVVSAISRIIE